MKKQIAAIYALIACAPAHALTGNTLYDWARSDDISFRLTASAYVQGVIDDDYAWKIVDQTVAKRGDVPTGMRHVCVPNNATLEQDLDVVKLYISQHPEERSYNAVQMVREALLAAFHCN